MIQILFLDQDRSYCQRVCSRLNAGSTRFQCFDSSDYKHPVPIPDSNVGLLHRAVDLARIEADWGSTLVVYNPQQYFHPPEKSYTMILSESLDDSNRNADSDGLPIAGIYKYDSVQSIWASIEEYLGSHPDLSAMEGEKNLMCVAGAACPARRKKAIDRIRQEKLELGLKVVQIDFCPPYLSDYSDAPTHGYSLSDAFLRLMADDLSYEELGMFLIPRADGTLQFRPIERADDLFECKPAHIRKFVELVREWIDHASSPYFVFIQCAAIPFSFIYAVAVLCDALLLVNPDSKDSSSIAFNKELGFLLANLPGSCHMEEISLPCSSTLLTLIPYNTDG